MPLEATMMIIDNSEFMRNGDYQPTRFEAQSDAVTTVFGSKTDSNPENTVGVMTSAGKGPEVLVTHTKDLGQILQGLHSSSQKISGQVDIPTALSVAQLALKHRQNKNLRQRIILFIGSPLEGSGADEKAMVKLAKKLKKNNIAVDVVSFGDDEGRDANEGVLKAFVENVNSSDNSHFVTIPPGTDILSDIILQSPILSGDFPGGGPAEGAAAASGSGAAAGGAGGDFEFGVDPSLDPELAMALRMSLEEERARQAAAASTSAVPTLAPIPEGSSTAPASASAPVPAAPSSAPPAVTVATSEDIDEDDEDAMLARALAMSQTESGGGEDIDMEDAVGEDDDEDEEMSEEEAIQKAIQMSMQEDQEKEEKK